LFAIAARDEVKVKGGSTAMQKQLEQYLVVSQQEAVISQQID